MEHHLKHPMPPVGWPEQPATCGGSQRALSSAAQRRCGCGVVSALDLLRYLHLYHPGMDFAFFRGAYTQPLMSPLFYDSCARRLSQHYLPILPPIGTNGPALSAGINRLFRCDGLGLHARWGVRPDRFWQTAGTMLDRDFPVLFSVGRPFPEIWSDKALPLWQNGRISCRVRAHFLLMTGLDETWCYVATWGRAYAIRRADFDHYRRSVSTGGLCNLLELRPLD